MATVLWISLGFYDHDESSSVDQTSDESRAPPGDSRILIYEAQVCLGMSRRAYQ